MFFTKLKRAACTLLILAPVTMLLATGCVERQMIPPHDGRFHEEAVTEQRNIPMPADAADTKEAVDIYPPVATEITTAIDDLLLPVLTHVNGRILTYEKKLQFIEALELKVMDISGNGDMEGRISDCRSQVQDILNRYHQLHQHLLKKHTVATEDLIKGETILNLWEDDFRFLESECRALVGHDTMKTAFPVDDKELSIKGLAIADAYKKHQYWQVIDKYEELAAVHGEFLPGDTTFLYGQALAKIGRGTDATRVFKALLARVQTPEEAGREYELIQLIADMAFAHENFKKAEQFYGEIVDAYHGLSRRNQWAARQLSVLQVAGEKDEEVRAYANFLKSYLTYNPERDGFLVVKKAEAFINSFPHSTVAASVDFLKTTAAGKAEQWYQKLLERVNILAGEENYQEALLTIERVPRIILPLEKQRELLDMADRLRAEESLTRAARQLNEKLLIQERWNEGMTHLDSDRYDQAIESFGKLLKTSDAERAEKKINEIANHAAREDRRRAAELFFRANRTHDMESKKKLLLASRQLLQNILIKYPQADVADRARQNLNRIEKEIYTIDPDLLSVPVGMGGRQVLAN